MVPPPAARPALVALDGGTSSLRAWLLDAAGGVLDARRSDRGLLTLTRAVRGDHAAAYAAVFHDTCGDWLEAAAVPALARGMVGSAQGGWTRGTATCRRPSRSPSTTWSRRRTAPATSTSSPACGCPAAQLLPAT